MYNLVFHSQKTASNSQDNVTRENLTEQLGTIRRQLIGLNASNSKPLTKVEAEYGVSNWNLATAKLHILLVLSIVGADGVSELESDVFMKRMTGIELDKLLGKDHFLEAVQFAYDTLANPKSLVSSEEEIKILTDQYASNLRDLGYLNNTLRAVIVAALLEAIAIARADGYSPQEQQTSKSIANMFDINTQTLELIEKFTELEQKLLDLNTNIDKNLQNQIEELSNQVTEQFAPRLRLVN